MAGKDRARRLCTFVDYENVRISLRENFRPVADAE